MKHYLIQTTNSANVDFDAYFASQPAQAKRVSYNELGAVMLAGYMLQGVVLLCVAICLLRDLRSK